MYQIGVFLCNINIEDGENMQHFDILCFTISRKVKTQLKCKKKNICAVDGEGAVSDRKCQKWFVKFFGTIDVLAK